MIVVAILVLLAEVQSKKPFQVNQESISDWLAEENLKLEQPYDVYETFQVLLERVKLWATGELDSIEKNGMNEDVTFGEEYPYWNFLPQNLGAAIPNRAAYLIQGAKCFDYEVFAEWESDDLLSVKLTASSKHHLEKLCTDHLLLESGTSFLVEHVSEEGVYEYEWEVPDDAIDSERWDLDQKGVRINHFLHSPAISYKNILKTLLLFVPEFSANPPSYFFEMNREFLESYTEFSYPERDPSLNVDLDDADINSGDLFSLIRFNGLSSTLSWGMGSTSSHTTAALWIGGQLYVVESTMANVCE